MILLFIILLLIGCAIVYFNTPKTSDLPKTRHYKITEHYPRDKKGRFAKKTAKFYSVIDMVRDA